jgi:hypothetical protein
MIDRLRRSPDNQFFMNLMELLQSMDYEILRLIVKTTDKDEILRLQGKAQVLEGLIYDLTRKPTVASEHTGSFT